MLVTGYHCIVAVFPLQDELIEAVVRFASAKINRPNDAVASFGGIWHPTDKPTLRTCRHVQREVRRWLDDRPLADVVFAYVIHSDIKLVGTLGASMGKDAGDHAFEVTWDWFVKDVPLRGVCALAVATIWQSGLKDRVGRCKRAGCSNYYLDRKGRGKRYCGTDECNDARNRERVYRWRGAL